MSQVSLAPGSLKSRFSSRRRVLFGSTSNVRALGQQLQLSPPHLGAECSCVLARSTCCATTKCMRRRLARSCAPDEDTQSTAKVQSGRDRARPLCASAPDPGADHTHVSRCPRRYATCAWTPRCARALICDREACGQHRAGARGCNGLCKGGRISPAFHRRRRGSRRPKQAGGHVTPCSRILFVGGEPGGAGRAHSELKQGVQQAPRRACMEQGGGEDFRARGGT